MHSHTPYYIGESFAEMTPQTLTKDDAPLALFYVSRN